MNLQLLTMSDYYDFIQTIINHRGQWSLSDDYWEGHHIIPKSLGGTGETYQKHENIIRLTAAEHFTAHRLLAELFPDEPKLQYAFWAMCTLSNAAIIATPEEYEAAKIARSKTIGLQARAALIGGKSSEETRLSHSSAQAGELNGFYGKTHSKATREKLSMATSKPVRHINTGIEYSSSYEAAEKLGISRVLINNCCRGKQESTCGGMKFEYVNPEDFNRGIPGKNTKSKYERRREIIELRKQVLLLDEKYPNILSDSDKIRISKLATCENRRYLEYLLRFFSEE